MQPHMEGDVENSATISLLTLPKCYGGVRGAYVVAAEQSPVYLRTCDFDI